ncbi:hypothetical protein [Bosea sp. (in: a-proteobacteria)]|uniref:hypothetical protein n=1 Tax=Bosea sp. (in: a-proteobacteria) TaxID=1871050 RepID=UPI001ACD5AEE|nr:hypothetical protein [Bosea sp. (in: a-proteobacteria)]MBN9441800.1 hypothetical protein [Bosea sp. (in: a-proteobacteria)]
MALNERNVFNLGDFLPWNENFATLSGTTGIAWRSARTEIGLSFSAAQVRFVDGVDYIGLRRGHYRLQPNLFFSTMLNRPRIPARAGERPSCDRFWKLAQDEGNRAGADRFGQPAARLAEADRSEPRRPGRLTAIGGLGGVAAPPRANRRRCMTAAGTASFLPLSDQPSFTSTRPE